MLALVFDPSPVRLPAAGVLSRVKPWLPLAAPGPLSLRELEETQRPGPDWTRLEVLRTGVCGSDVKQATLQASSDNPLSALISFPHVPGHEIVAAVAEPRPDLGWGLGQAVAVDPWLGCAARGYGNPCPACRAGFPPHCSRVLNGGPWGSGHGMHLGTVRGLPGGFAQFIFAHSSQIHPLPDGLDQGVAVLADPLAVALHAVAQAPEGGDGPVLVIGAGTIGLSLALAATTRWPQRSVFVTCAWDLQRSLVADLGAQPLPAGAEAVVLEMAAVCGAALARPWRGGPWTLGAGTPLVLDSIGTPATTQLALRVLAPGGTLVTVGVGRPARAETTLTYYKEARILGSNGYGIAHPGGPHLLDSALRLLTERADLVSSWLTHLAPIRGWREAFMAAARPDRSGAIKVSLSLRED